MAARMSRTLRFRRLALSILCALAVSAPAVSTALQWARYDSDADNEAIRYSSTTPSDAITKLQRRIDAGTATLHFERQSGYLRSLLDELTVPVASQVLVASNVSFQAERISSQRPRALYFGDDIYVGWVQGSRVLEIAAVDSQLGAIFYTLDQEGGTRPRFRRQTTLCLQCHDSPSLTHGVPGLIPLKFRAGGWSVTGTSGSDVHVGLDLHRQLDVRPYLGAHSDMVALMVLDHQVQLHNLLTRANYRTRMARHFDEGSISDTTTRVVGEVGESLLEGLLFADQPPIARPVSPRSAFARDFARRGPYDRLGRSFFQLDLKGRLFRYACSYLIYSESFDALPAAVKTYVFKRLREVLTGEVTSDRFAHLSRADRASILEILVDTKPDFAAWHATAFER
jgi:hypothetical protein